MSYDVQQYTNTTNEEMHRPPAVDALIKIDVHTTKKVSKGDLPIWYKSHMQLPRVCGQVWDPHRGARAGIRPAMSASSAHLIISASALVLQLGATFFLITERIL